MALRGKIDAAATCQRYTRRRAGDERRKRRRLVYSRAMVAGEDGEKMRTEVRAGGGFRSGGGWSIRANIFSTACWSGRPKFSAASTVWASALAPFYRAWSFSAAAGDTVSGVRAPYRRFFGRAAFLAVPLDMLLPSYI